MCSGAAHKTLSWVVFHVKHNQYDFQEFGHFILWCSNLQLLYPD